MTSIFTDQALHPGRDANDAWWIVVRRGEDWGEDRRPDATRFDPTREVLELAPGPLADPGAVGTTATAPDGSVYAIVDGRVVVRGPCDGEATPLAGLAGDGTAIGQLGEPVALAVDERGWLYVVERGNHRVTVVDPGDRRCVRVVITLGATDGWGAPIASDDRGGLRAPMAIAVGPHRIFVGAADGWIVTFDRHFRPGPRFRAVAAGTTAGALLGLAPAGDGGVLVLAADRSLLEHLDCDGRFVADVGLDAGPAVFADAAGGARFALEGTRIVGPIDGGRDGLAWHQVVVDAELPPGTRLEVQTWAADAVIVSPTAPPIAPTGPPASALSAVDPTPWAPAAPVAMPAVGEPRTGERPSSGIRHGSACNAIATLP